MVVRFKIFHVGLSMDIFIYKVIWNVWRVICYSSVEYIQSPLKMITFFMKHLSAVRANIPGVRSEEFREDLGQPWPFAAAIQRGAILGNHRNVPDEEYRQTSPTAEKVHQDCGRVSYSSLCHHLIRDSSEARLCVNAAPTCQKAHHFLPRVP